MVTGTSSEIVTDDDKEHLSLVAEVAIEGAPKKLIKGNSSELPSSINAVLSNYDLLFDILLRLPVLSLVLFTSVSKHWFNIIKSPRFIASRSRIPNIDPPSALLIRRMNAERGKPLYDFESFDVRIPSKKLTPSEAPRRGYVVQSCNGLLLCWIHPYKFYVYNPTTKLFKMIPTNSPSSFARIAFDPTKSPHYKVIQKVYVENELGYQLHIYSSETGIWSVFDDHFDSLTFGGFDEGVYYNDVIHWLDRASSKNALHIKLDIANEQPVLTAIEIPVIFDGKSCCESKLFESRGCLLLLGKDHAHSQQLNVFEISSDDSEWSLKFIVNLDDIMMPSPTTWMTWRVWSIVLGEREVDSFMIIDLLNKVVQYNPVSKTVHTLTDLDSIESFIDFHAFQFITSFAGV